MSPAPAFELSHVSKTLSSVRVLDQVSLRFGVGQWHALCGPNASGKTTLLRILAGRIPIDSGEVRCRGAPLTGSGRGRNRGIRYLTQHFSLYGELTAGENLQFCADMHGIPQSSRAILQGLDDFGLQEHRRSRTHTLSGGVRQRLMLAAATLGDPAILLLDEPTAALDRGSRRQFWELLRRRRTAENTIVLTTHLEEDVAHCDSRVELRAGRVEAP